MVPLGIAPTALLEHRFGNKELVYTLLCPTFHMCLSHETFSRHLKLSSPGSIRY